MVRIGEDVCKNCTEGDIAYRIENGLKDRLVCRWCHQRFDYYGKQYYIPYFFAKLILCCILTD